MTKIKTKYIRFKVTKYATEPKVTCLHENNVKQTEKLCFLEYSHIGMSSKQNTIIYWSQNLSHCGIYNPEIGPESLQCTVLGGKISD